MNINRLCTLRSKNKLGYQTLVLSNLWNIPSSKNPWYAIATMAYVVDQMTITNTSNISKLIILMVATQCYANSDEYDGFDRGVLCKTCFGWIDTKQLNLLPTERCLLWFHKKIPTTLCVILLFFLPRTRLRCFFFASSTLSFRQVISSLV